MNCNRKLIATILSGAILSLSPAFGLAATPQLKDLPAVRTVFAYPKQNGLDTSIRDEAIKFINGAEKGSQIRASFFMASDLMVVNALKRAAIRGADIKVALDKTWSRTEATRAFKEKLTAAIGESNVVLCEKNNKACGAPGNNHNKYFIFSSVKQRGGRVAKNVVLQTSSNMSPADYGKYQDLLIIENDPEIFGHYSRYWRDKSGRGLASEYTLADNGNTYSSEINTQLFSFPTEEIDPHMRLLDRVMCKKGESRVDATFSIFRGKRANAFARRLKELQDQGCTVHLLLRDEKRSNDQQQLLKNLKLPHTLVKKEEADLNLKVLLADAYFKNRSGTVDRRQYVMTGTAEMKEESIKANAETVVRVLRPAIYRDYLEYLEYLRKPARIRDRWELQRSPGSVFRKQGFAD